MAGFVCMFEVRQTSIVIRRSAMYWTRFATYAFRSLISGLLIIRASKRCVAWPRRSAWRSVMAWKMLSGP